MKLSNINLLETLNSPEYLPILATFSERKARKKEILFLPNHYENNVIIVKKGKIRVYLAFDDKEFTLSILEPGDVFSTHTRAYTQCLEDCEFLVSSAENFRKIIKQYPSFTFNIIQVLGDLLHNSITIINGLVFKDVTERLVEFLVNAAEEKGIITEQEIKLNLGLNIEQIAMLVGASRQTVSVLLSDFSKAGIIHRVDQRTLIITNMELLKSLGS
ncbi:Crp/Fnr family transcriptional regulator [Sporomusa carbonis]|uniref:Crp/Fnr family transcriptional regulator n=1 Tax=Sporomusa carbonis TaxID=3076075 RepID=UPI003C7ECF7A